MAEQLDRQVISDGGMDKAKTCVTSQEDDMADSFGLEWTHAVTDNRLRDWNDACISHRFGVRTTQWSHIRAFEEEVGWTYDALTKAVLHYYASQYGDAAWILPTNAAMTQVQRPTLGSKRIRLGPAIGRNYCAGQRLRLCPSGPWMNRQEGGE